MAPVPTRKFTDSLPTRAAIARELTPVSRVAHSVRSRSASCNFGSPGPVGHAITIFERIAHIFNRLSGRPHAALC